MGKGDKASGRLSELRKRAEQKAEQDIVALRDQPAAKMREIMYELQVHQIELEMQNEELRRAQLELEGLRRKYFDLFDFAPVGYFTFDEKGLIVEVNLTGADLLGMPKSGLLKKDLSHWIAPESEDTFYLHRKEIIGTGVAQRCELKLRKSDGSEFFGQLVSKVEVDDEGNFEGLRTTVTDITERKEAEAALERERDKLREYFENLPALAFNITFDGKIGDCNQVAVETLGYESKDELVGKPLLNTVYPPSSCKKAGELLEKWKREGKLKNEEIQVVTKQGELLDVLLNVTTIIGHNGVPIHSLSTQTVITERKRAEEALRNSEEKYRVLVESAGQPIFTVARDGVFEFMNEASGAALGGKGEDFIGKSMWDLFPPEMADGQMAEITKALESGRFRTSEKESIVQGRKRWYLARIQPLQEPDGTFGRALVILADITERKETEEAVRESEERLRAYMDSVAIGIAVISPEMEILEMNESLKRAFPEIDVGEHPKCHGSFYDPPKARICAYCPAVKVFEDGQTRFAETGMCSDGNYYMVSAAPLRDQSGKVVKVIETIQNVTERLEYQERLKAMASQLSRVQELERRKLSKRLHDSISQSLAVAKLNLHLSTQSVTDSELAGKLDGVSEELGAIMEESYSLMLELSSPILYELGLVSALKALLESRFLEDQGIKCKLSACEERLGLGRDLRVTLYQAVRELLVNSVKHAKAENVEVLIEKEGECLRIGVKDDGVGFDASEVGLPSTTGGFGLFNLRESLEGIGGELKIESRPGRGTVGRITVPLQCESKV